MSSPVQVLSSRIKNFFLGKVEGSAQFDLERANAVVVLYILVLSLMLLVPLQFLYLFLDESDIVQQVIGIASIIFYASGLYYIKVKKEVKAISAILLTFSLVIFSINLWLYPESGITSGLHLCVNLLFSFNLLRKNLAFVSLILHLTAVILWFVSVNYNWDVDFVEPVKQPLVELIFATLVLVVILVVLLAYYNRAHKRLSENLVSTVEELRIAKSSAEEMNQLKTSFLANMSHEIRTPLNAIIGINEILREKVNDDEFVELLDIQDKSGQRLLSTLEGILSFSRIEAEVALNLTKVNFYDVAKEVVLNQKVAADKKQIQLQIDKPDHEIFIYVDETMIYQVITNLVGNAIKFTNPSGIIVLQFHTADSLVQLDVKDSGIGIAPEFMNRLFEPFEQESTGRSKSYQGSGLGLSITKKFIELMGGRIEVNSSKGKGSTFSILVPLHLN